MGALSLFSGIGGLDLGWELATGMRPTAFAEVDAHCCNVLAARWPGVPNLGDVREIGDGECKAIIGGFPCQPFSTAARGRNRSELDLWPDMLRIIRLRGPRWVFAENVSERAIQRAADDLAADAFAVAIGALSSADIGGVDDRNRWWLVADADPQGEPLVAEHDEVAGLPPSASAWSGREATRVLGVADGPAGRLDGPRRACIGNAVNPLQAAVAARLLLRRLGVMA